MLLMVRQCFQFSVPLRSVGDNASFATSNAVALAINGALIIILMPRFGLWGPTLGLVVGQMWTSIYLARGLMKRFNLSWRTSATGTSSGLALAASLVAAGRALRRADRDRWTGRRTGGSRRVRRRLRDSRRD
jgi:O-antigen/teichoic acid export membrane protein